MRAPLPHVSPPRKTTTSPQSYARRGLITADAFSRKLHEPHTDIQSALMQPAAATDSALHPGQSPGQRLKNNVMNALMKLVSSQSHFENIRNMALHTTERQNYRIGIAHLERFLNDHHLFVAPREVQALKHIYGDDRNQTFLVDKFFDEFGLALRAHKPPTAYSQVSMQEPIATPSSSTPAERAGSVCSVSRRSTTSRGSILSSQEYIHKIHHTQRQRILELLLITQQGKSGLRLLRKALCGVAGGDLSGTVNYSDFVLIMRDIVPAVPESDVRDIFDFLADGLVFLQARTIYEELRGKLPAARESVIRKLFISMLRPQQSAVLMSDVIAVFDATRHPNVIRNTHSVRAVMSDIFDLQEFVNDLGLLTWRSWLDCFADLSVSTPNDADFQRMLTEPWASAQDKVGKKGGSRVGVAGW